MKNKTITLVVFCALCAVVNAEENKVIALTADEAVGYALQNSRQIQSGSIDLETQKRASETAWNILLPGVEVGASIIRANEIMGAPGLTEKDHWNMAGSAGISLNFNLAMIETIKVAGAGYDVEKITFEETQKRLERDVRKLFYNLLLMQESIKISEENLLAAQNRVADSGQNYRAGKISELDFLQTQVAYQNQIPEVLRTKHALKQNINAFALLLGMKAGTEIELEGAIEISGISEKASEETALQSTTTRAEMTLQKNIDMLTVQRKALNLQVFTPSLNLSFGLQPMASLTALGNGTPEPWQDKGSFSASLVWNLTGLLPFSSNRQQVKNIDADMAKLRIQQVEEREQVINGVQQLMDTLELSRVQIAALEANITLASRNYELTEAAYRNGRVDLSKVQDAELSLNQARQGLLGEQFNYISALLDIEYLTGARLR
ncbi:transporter [Spirochaetia bacterium]|nr:transporter [Spirochaetia bacterium]